MVKGFYSAGSADIDLESFEDGITALGGGGATGATKIKCAYNEVDTVALAGDSVMLPKAQPGAKVVIHNASANALDVFPWDVGVDQIDDAGIGVATSQAAGSVLVYRCMAYDNWYTQASAPGLAAVQAGIVANAGGGQAGAVPITASFAEIGTVANPGDSVLLPAAVVGREVVINNSTATSANVFPDGTDQINSGGAGVQVAQAGGITSHYYCFVAGNWIAYSVSSAGMATAQSGIIAHGGGGQPGATPITAALAEVATVALGGDSVLLPAAKAGMRVTVHNKTAATSMDVFPDGTDQIDAGGAGTQKAQGGTITLDYICFADGLWVTK